MMVPLISHVMDFCRSTELAEDGPLGHELADLTLIFGMSWVACQFSPLQLTWRSGQKLFLTWLGTSGLGE